MKALWSNLLMTLTVTLASSPVFAGAVEAKKDGVEVFATAEKGAAVVATLKKGETATAGDRSGMYFKVTLPGGKAGFVSVLNVKIKAESGGGLNDAIRDAVKEGRSAAEETGARGRSAVMGVRGLDDNNTAMAGSVKPNLRAVYEMEDFQLPKDKFDQQAAIVESDIRSLMSH
jgi:hypothetical protein